MGNRRLFATLVALAVTLAVQGTASATPLLAAANHGATRTTFARLSTLGIATCAWFLLVGIVFGVAWSVGRRVRDEVHRAAASPSQTALDTIWAGARRYRLLLWLLALSLYGSLMVMAISAVALPIILGVGYLDGAFRKAHLVVYALVTSGLVLWTVIGCLAVAGRGGGSPQVLPLAGQTRLVRLLAEAADRVGSPKIDTVWLSYGTVMGVAEVGGIGGALRGRPSRTLLVGVGLLPYLTVGQLRAIMAHECAHIAHADTSPGSIARTVDRSLAAMLDTLTQQGASHRINPAFWFLRGFHDSYARVAAGAEQIAEILADRASVRAVGSETAASALEASESGGRKFDDHFHSTISEVLATRVGLDNLYTYRPVAARGPLPPAWEEHVADDLASHPPVDHRTRWMRAQNVSLAPREGDDEPAWSVFEGREQIERRLTRSLKEAIASWYALRIPDVARVEEPPAPRQAVQPAGETPAAPQPSPGTSTSSGPALAGPIDSRPTQGPSMTTVSIGPVAAPDDYEEAWVSAQSWLRTDSDLVRTDYARLSPALRPIAAVRLCLDAVKDEGGLRGYLASPAGCLCDETVTGFELLGLPAAAAALREAVSFFPEGERTDTAARLARLEAVTGRTAAERDPFRVTTGALVKASKPYGAGITPECQAFWAAASEVDRWPPADPSLRTPGPARSADDVARRLLIDHGLARHVLSQGGIEQRVEGGKAWTAADVARFERTSAEARDRLWRPLLHAGLVAAMSPVERGIAWCAGTKMEPTRRLAGRWAAERAGVLAWAIGELEDLPRADEPMPLGILDLFPTDVGVFLAGAKLRADDELSPVTARYSALRLRDTYHGLIAQGTPAIPESFRAVGIDTEERFLAALARAAGETGPDITLGDQTFGTLRGVPWALARGIIRERDVALQWLSGAALNDSMYRDMVLVGAPRMPVLVRAPIGGFALSEARLKLLRPDLFGARGLVRSLDADLGAGPKELQSIRELLAGGLCRAAVVVSAMPFLVAAYNDELDCVVMLRFPSEVRPPHFSPGTRTICVNGMFVVPPVAPDLLVGEGSLGTCTNVHPLVVELLTDDIRRVNQVKALVPDQEWARAEELASQARRSRPDWARDGAPGRSRLSS